MWLSYRGAGHENNYLTVDEEPYFVLQTGEKFLVTQDRCPHRGGPLHLGEWNCHTKSLACPRHGRGLRLCVVDSFGKPFNVQKLRDCLMALRAAPARRAG